MGRIGYARVSPMGARQDLRRQTEALRAAGCERVFEDRASGADPDRPELAACLDHLRAGDVLVGLDLDRPGHCAPDLIALIDGHASRGVGFKALDSPMDTATPAGRAFLEIQRAFAATDRGVIRQRVLEGVSAPRPRSRKGGRPRIVTADKLRRGAASDSRPGVVGPGGLPGSRHADQHAVPLRPRRRHAEGAGQAASRRGRRGRRADEGAGSAARDGSAGQEDDAAPRNRLTAHESSGVDGRRGPGRTRTRYARRSSENASPPSPRSATRRLRHTTSPASFARRWRSAASS